MKITRIECIPVDVPIVPEFQITGSLGSHLHSPFLLVRVHTDEGLIGLGEVSCTPLWSGEDRVTAAPLIADFLVTGVVLVVYGLRGGNVWETVLVKMSVSGAEPGRAAQLAEWALGKGLK